MAPPIWASGTICPTTKPCVPPEKRPSVIKAEKNTLEVHLSDAELAERKAKWQAPPLKFSSGVLYKYIKNVSTASEGCVTDE